MDDRRILTLVTEILRDAGKPLLARDIVSRLLARGVTIEKSELNKLLWSSERNSLKQLVGDKETFQWKVIASAEPPVTSHTRSVSQGGAARQLAVNALPIESGEPELAATTAHPSPSLAARAQEMSSTKSVPISRRALPDDRVERLFRYLEQLYTLDLTITRELGAHANESPSFLLDVTSDLSNEWVQVGSFTNPDEAWLRIVRPEIPETPPVPDSLLNFVSASDDPSTPPVYREPEADSRPLPDEADNRRSEFTSWLQDSWSPWAELARPAFKAMKLYARVFALNQAIALRGSALELLWGTGQLCWQTKVGEIDYPLIITPLEIVFDDKRAVFEFRPKEREAELQVFPLLSGVEGIEFKVEALELLRKDFAQQVEDPRNRDQVVECFSSLVHQLDPKGRVSSDSASANVSNVPTVTYQHTVFLRPVSQHLWVQDFREIIQSIQREDVLPEFIQSLVADAGNADIENDGTSGSGHASGTFDKGRSIEPMFPLAANDEQLSILSATDRASGVVVQGPPGTGKSHTIANLISHYLAEGKRILVTSHSEKALSVLRNKLPEAIRQLCVSVLTSDSDSKRELQDSVRTIHARLGQPNSEADVEYLKRQLDAVKQNRLTVYHQLVDAEEREYASYTFGRYSGNPLELSRGLRSQRDRDGWLRDPVPVGFDFELSDSALSNLYRFLSVENPDFVDSFLFVAPNPSSLLSPDEFRELVQQEAECESTLREVGSNSAAGGRADDLDQLEELYADIQTHLRALSLFNSPWLTRLSKDANRDPNSLERWVALLRKAQEELKDLLSADQDRVGAQVSSLEFTDSEILQSVVQQLRDLASRLPSKGKVTFWAKLTLSKNARATLDGARVGGKVVDNGERLTYLVADLRVKFSLLKLAEQFAFLTDRVGAPALVAPTQLELIDTYADAVRDLEIVLVTARSCVGRIRSTAARLRIAISPDGLTHQDKIQEFSRLVRAKVAEAKLALVGHRFKIEAACLAKFQGQASTHGCVERLSAALSTRDADAWANELVLLGTFQDAAAHVGDVAEQLRYIWRTFPGTLAWLRRDEVAARRSRLLKPQWIDAMSFARASSFIGALNSEVSPQELRDQLITLEKEIEQVRGRLAAATAWHKQLKRISPLERLALKAWDEAVSALGKGTGKKEYVEAKRRAVRHAMQNAVTAVPVWIMPLQRVVESFHPPRPGLFDLVIVDESSQCDLRALAALYRGKKVIVVGDDKQVSPENVGTDQSKVNALIQQYLFDIPYKERFSISDSLYNVASLRLPQTVMLREHFRCVPQIIEFSNTCFYKNPGVADSGLIPMRLPLPSERLQFPLKSVFVPGQRINDANQEEAKAIVEKMAELIGTPAYAGKSFGVITLMANSAQSDLIQKFIHELIPESEIRARKIQVGDPKYFQGDERDVVFLSMVVGGPDDAFVAQTKDADKRRFNVAASRARDQMWLFHSVKASEIRNEECLRLKLLTFFSKANVQVPASPSGRQLNEFETAVAKMILARGYEVIPQFPAPGSGTIRFIDLVVEGRNARLAVECDGDRWHGREQWEADQRRENQLRRAGWVFWRVRGSEFYRNPETALIPLWSKLVEMGIEPAESAPR